MTDPKYAAFTALDPFFDIVQQGLAGLVDGGGAALPTSVTSNADKVWVVYLQA